MIRIELNPQKFNGAEYLEINIPMVVSTATVVIGGVIKLLGLLL